MQDAVVIDGHRMSSEGPNVPKSKADGVNISLSAPKYSVWDEKSQVYIYPADAPRPRHFESIIGSLRIQLRSVLPERLANGGSTVGKEVYVQFRNGRLITSKEDEIVAVENSSDYGVKTWDDDALVRTVKQARINHALQTAESDPEILEALKVKFGLTDFVDDTPKQAAPPEDPIEYQGGEYKPRKGKKG